MSNDNNKGRSVFGVNSLTGVGISSAVSPFDKQFLSFQAIASDGNSTCVGKLQASLNGEKWADVEDSSKTMTDNTILWEVSQVCAAQYRVHLTATDGAGVAASGTITGSVGVLDIAADDVGLAGNSIQVVLVDGGTAGSETVTVVDSVITVDIESGVSTVAQVISALEADVNAAALVDLTETTSGALEADSVTLSGGLEIASNMVVLTYLR